MEWISVNDKFPEQKERRNGYKSSEEVIVAVNYFGRKYTTVDYIKNGKWDKHPMPSFHGSITHWMPLPDPPKD